MLGGSDDDTCSPQRDCVREGPPLSDGAIYDAETDTWQPLPAAPVPLGYMIGAVVGDTLYLSVTGFEPGSRFALLSISASDRVWHELALPASSANETLALAAAGPSVIGYRGSHEHGWAPDLLYDPAADSWAELPPDPLEPSFDRQIVSTAAGPVLLATALIPDPGSARPSLLEAAALNLTTMAWQALPESEVLCCGGPWEWTGDRLVNASIQTADGGSTNAWGRAYPVGGILDPATGHWDPLPAPPADSGPRPGLTAGGDGWAVGLDGWALEPANATWVAIPNTPEPTDGGAAETWVRGSLFVWGGFDETDTGIELLANGWRLPLAVP